MTVKLFFNHQLAFEVSDHRRDLPQYPLQSLFFPLIRYLSNRSKSFLFCYNDKLQKIK